MMSPNRMPYRRVAHSHCKSDLVSLRRHRAHPNLHRMLLMRISNCSARHLEACANSCPMQSSVGRVRGDVENVPVV